jgi:hypothetical protein
MVLAFQIRFGRFRKAFKNDAVSLLRKRYRRKPEVLSRACRVGGSCRYCKEGRKHAGSEKPNQLAI